MKGRGVWPSCEENLTVNVTRARSHPICTGRGWHYDWKQSSLMTAGPEVSSNLITGSHDDHRSPDKERDPLAQTRVSLCSISLQSGQSRRPKRSAPQCVSDAANCWRANLDGAGSGRKSVEQSTTCDRPVVGPFLSSELSPRLRTRETNERELRARKTIAQDMVCSNGCWFVVAELWLFENYIILMTRQAYKCSYLHSFLWHASTGHLFGWDPSQWRIKW